MNPNPTTRYDIIGLPHIPGTSFLVIPELTPRRVFVGRPNPPIYAEDGTRLDIPQATANEGEGWLVAHLHEVGVLAPRFAYVLFPSSRKPRDIPLAWVHDPAKIAAIRIWPKQPWRSDAA